MTKIIVECAMLWNDSVYASSRSQLVEILSFRFSH